VEIEPGRRLNIYCNGSGSPTVILEAGQSDDVSARAAVQPIVAAKTRVCSYDRAGFGFSDPNKRPDTAVNFADDLHRLLAVAEIEPPYVLVGHSLGGMYVRLYADLYPAEVAGMVLVVPANEEQRIAFTVIAEPQRTPAEWAAYLADYYGKRRECIAAAAAGFTPDTPMYKQCVDEPDPHFSEAINNALRARRSFGDLPLIVLAASSPRPRRKNETEAHFALSAKVQDSLYQQLVALSTRGRYKVVPNSTHQIQIDQPQAVSDAIFEVMGLARPDKAE
jgi:pimeloyl-ACP methyl ester carboxylesterase